MNKAISRILIFLVLISSIILPITSTAQEKDLVAYVSHYRLVQKGILVYKDQDGNWVNGELGEKNDVVQEIDLKEFEDQETIDKILNVIAYPYDLGFMFSTEDFSRSINKFSQTKDDFIKNYYNHGTDKIEINERYLTDGVVKLKYNAELTPQVEPLKVSDYTDEDIYILLGQNPNNPNPETKEDLEAVRKLQPIGNSDIPEETSKGKLNEEGKKKGFAVYGSPEDVSGNDYKNKQGKIVSKDYKEAIPRYLGYDLNGNPFTNEAFPPDVETGLEPWEKIWIDFPWKKDINNQKQPKKSKYNEIDPYRAEAISWLNQLDWAGKNGWTGEKLIDHFMIQSPQADYTQGSAVGWHEYIDENGNKRILYQTFTIPPKEKIDFSKLNEVEAYIIFIPLIIEYWVEAKTDNLAIKDIRNETSEIEYDEMYDLKFDVYNMCLKDAYDVTVDYYLQYPNELKYMFTDEGNTVESLGVSTGELNYNIPEDYKRDTFELVAKLNMNEKHPAKFEDGTIIEESTMADNEVSILIPIKDKESFDLEVVDIKYKEYMAGSYSPVIVTVRNNGTTNLVTNLKLDVEGNTITRDKVFIPAGKTGNVTFGLQTPNVETRFKMTAKVDYNNKIKETNENNNTKTINSRTIRKQEKICSPSYVTWTEYRDKGEYKSGDRIKTWTHTEERCSGSGENRTCRTITVVDGYTVRFYAKLRNVKVEVDWRNKDQGFIKSGYGIEVKAKADIVSNYDKQSQIKNIQRAYLYTPSEIIEMEGSNGRFELPVNPKSVIESKVHYIPVHTLDGDYKIMVALGGASTPGGILNICEDVTIKIKGDMYEDDNTY
ncbi:Athe_2463 domain-containing protein [Maledivibacter halophilus]|uniref:CARDB protein n=1 Tax=Maledivibacter halophilus TaxID=36842 RepID=A0A1T5M4Q3_9FIRM|nr:CARDB domain-containing protein [Maledivibacter halophilus]SKC83024.1 CARDB protein [Maledivibacter halophilus]